MKNLRTVGHLLRTYWLLTFSVLSALVAFGFIILKRGDTAQLILFISVLISLLTIFIYIIEGIRSGKFGVDALPFAAIVTALQLHQNWVAIILVIVLACSELVKELAERYARSELQSLRSHAPTDAHLVKKNKTLTVPVSDIEPNDTVVIQPGEIVPVDAVITNGSSSLNESRLTGEMTPQNKTVGDQILCGSINDTEIITAKAIRTMSGSQYQQIAKLVEAVGYHPAPFARLADQFSLPFTIIALTIAGCAWIISKQPIRFLDVLVVASPFSLVIATPIAFIAGISRAARDGIIFKTGRALEALSEARTVAFEKTGTLTIGKPVMVAVTAFSPYSQSDVLMYAAAIEQNSNHALGQSIVAAAINKQLKIPKTKHIRELAGSGLVANIKNLTVVAGQLAILKELAIHLPNNFKPSSITQNATFIAVDGSLAGYITFRDEFREESKSSIESLQAMGIHKTLLVTGDNKATAEATANSLNITDIVSEALPGEKVLAIERLTDRPVAFVGDGSQGAPMLMAADVGIALGARGNIVASEAADIVILKDDLRYIVRALAIARRSFRIVSECIFTGIGISIILMVVFATGTFSPIVGIMAQMVLNVFVVLNALRAHNAAPIVND